MPFDHVTIAHTSEPVTFPTFLGHISIDLEHSVVVLQQLEHVAVGLPEELHPGREDDTIRPFLRSLATHHTQQEAAQGGTH